MGEKKKVLTTVKQKDLFLSYERAGISLNHRQGWWNTDNAEWNLKEIWQLK